MIRNRPDNSLSICRLNDSIALRETGNEKDLRPVRIAPFADGNRHAVRREHTLQLMRARCGRHRRFPKGGIDLLFFSNN